MCTGSWKHIWTSNLPIPILLPIPIDFYWKIGSTLSRDIFLSNKIQLYNFTIKDKKSLLFDLFTLLITFNDLSN